MHFEKALFLFTSHVAQPVGSSTLGASVFGTRPSAIIWPNASNH